MSSKYIKHVAVVGLILQRVGAHRVVYPEAASGEAVAQSLHVPDVLAHVPLGPGTGISTLRAPTEWAGKSVGEVQLPGHDAVIILAIQRGMDILAMPTSTEHVQSDDLLALLIQDTGLLRKGHRLRRSR